MAYDHLNKKILHLLHSEKLYTFQKNIGATGVAHGFRVIGQKHCLMARPSLADFLYIYPRNEELGDKCDKIRKFQFPIVFVDVTWLQKIFNIDHIKHPLLGSSF